VDEVIKEQNIDSSRVYVIGLSMGGYGTWALAARYPDRFAAVAPICGGGETIGVLLADAKRKAAMKTLGIWAFHGAKDPVVKLEESERMIAAYKRIGSDARLTVYPEAQHDSWTETYVNRELYTWLLSHSRGE
jgi:predicted peptidase